MCMRSGSRNDQRVTKAHHGREGREIGEGKRISMVKTKEEMVMKKKIKELTSTNS